MKFRVKNIKSGNFVTSPITKESAIRLFDNLYSDSENYKIVPFEIDIDKMSSELKPMDELVKTAIEFMKNNVLKCSINQEVICDVLVQRYNEKNFMISEKENYLLWSIIYKNKNIVEDPKLLSVSHQYFIYC